MPKSKFFILVSLMFVSVLAQAQQRNSFFGRDELGSGVCQVDLLALDQGFAEVMFGVVDNKGSYVHFEVVTLERENEDSPTSYSSLQLVDRTAVEIDWRDHEMIVSDPKWKTISYTLTKAVKKAQSPNPESKTLYSCPKLARTGA